MKLYTLFLFSLLCGQGMLLRSYNKYKLKNLNLCGRDSSINPVDKIQCTNTAFSQLTHCNDNFKVNQCHGVEVKLSCGDVSTEFSKGLSNIDHSAHNNESLRQMQITLHNCTHSNFERVSLLTDMFLTPRLWWQVVQETFTAPTQSIEITLNRYHPMYEPHLRLLSSIHYPTHSASCNKSVMLVNRNTCVHPGWGSVLEQYYDASKQLPYAVIGMHVSSSNRRDDNTSFISSADCMERVDKWGCAFLSTTNCTVPRAMVACHTHNCVQHIPEAVHFSLLFSHAAADGVLVQRHHAAYKSAVRGAQSPVDGQQLSLSAHLTPPPFTYALPYALVHSTYDSYDVESTDKINFTGQLSYILRWSPVYHMESANTLFHFRYLLRTNHFYRTRVQQSIDNFHATNNITPSTRCVAAQVRRGDRVIYGVNMTAFCANATAPLSASHPANLCLNKHQQLERCDDLMPDKGCESGVPFGAVTLEAVLGKAELLVGAAVRVLIVFTDDAEWLNREREALNLKQQVQETKHAGWRVLNLQPPRSKSTAAGKNKTSTSYWDDEKLFPGYHFVRSTGGTASGVYFHASLQLARQCEAFLGHFGSEIPPLFYSSMCLEHGAAGIQQQGVCPPVYDLRLGL